MSRERPRTGPGTARRPGSSRSTRREWIGRVGAGVCVALAGCAAGDDGSDADGPTDEATGTEPAATEPAETTGAGSSGGGTGTPDGAPTSGGGTGTPDGVHADYETTDVRVLSPDGTEKGSVTAAVADTGSLRYTGLSDTEALPEDRGMLFVYGEPQEDLTYVMREMDFGIDIVFADADGTITRIHHAPAPGPNEDGEDQGYPGSGQYVLEVNYDWTTDRGVEAGDVLSFDL